MNNKLGHSSGVQLFYMYLLVAALIGVLLFLMFVCGGCLSSVLPAPPPGAINNIGGGNGAMKLLLSSMGWLAILSVLAIGLSVFMLVNGNKLGVAGIIAASVTLAASLVVAKYAIWIAWFALVGIMISVSLLCIYAVFVRWRAVKEIIVGVQLLKTEQKVKANNSTAGTDTDAGNNTDAEINDVLKSVQSKATQKLVRFVKAGLKLTNK